MARLWRTDEIEIESSLSTGTFCCHGLATVCTLSVKLYLSRVRRNVLYPIEPALCVASRFAPDYEAFIEAV